MSKEPSQMTLDELAVDMRTRADPLGHLTAKAEFALRQTRAQLAATEAQTKAARATERNANYMLASVIVAAISAVAAAGAAYLNYLSSLKIPK